MLFYYEAFQRQFLSNYVQCSCALKKITKVIVYSEKLHKFVIKTEKRFLIYENLQYPLPNYQLLRKISLIFRNIRNQHILAFKRSI